MSSPEIAIHKKYQNRKYTRTTLCQANTERLFYVFYITNCTKNERGQLTTTESTKKYETQCRKTVVNWLRKFGDFDGDNQTPSNMPKSPEHKIIELEARVKLLEKQKALLEREAYVADKKAIIFDMMIGIAEKEC